MTAKSVSLTQCDGSATLALDREPRDLLTETLLQRELMALRDPAAGIRAHLEGRAPRWVNG